MQTVSSEFTTRTAQSLRKIKVALFISFFKQYDSAIDFFTIGVSTIGGTDILKGTGSVVQEWDKYDYEDFSNRILAVEINRETEPPTNPISLATCDLVLDNHDDIFTPGNTNSPLDGQLQTRRPVRVNMGFTNEMIPKFIGLTTGKPEIDERSKTARIHCIDFLQAIMNIPLDEEVMFINARTDEIVSAMLERGGLDPSQFDLDTGTVIIPFAYFPKGSKIGTALRDVAEAELGNVSMLEDGTPRFVNRQNWAGNTTEWEFDKDNVYDRQSMDNDNIINVVEVYSQAREVQAKQKLWEAASPIELPPGVATEVFADFRDDYGDLPVTTCDDPEYIDGASTSLFATNDQQDGSGSTSQADVTLTSTDLFSTAFKMVFTNSSGRTLYLTQLELFATPAKVVNDIYHRLQDDASVGDKDGVEEHVHEIRNNLIQDETAANTIAQIILTERANELDQESWINKSVPQLQLGDLVDYADENTDESYFVTRINDIVNDSGYRQKLQVSKRSIEEYFRIGISTIGGSDKLGP